VAVEVAAWACLKDHLPAPAVVAGYSVGELAAFSAAGVFDAATGPGVDGACAAGGSALAGASTAVALSRLRAAAMDRSASGTSTGLLAIRDVPAETIAACCERHGLAVAIRLGPDRAVVGGPAESLQRAMADPALAAGQVSRLAVQVASHTPWMQAAVADFAAQLRGLALQAPRVPLVSNFTGAAVPRSAEEAALCLSAQLASPVLWDACLEAVAERQPACVLEVGPGTTLATMWRASHPGIPVRSVDEFRSAEAVVAWVRRQLS
jgi:[acyl-carrier-protein] S-malonyltransferase